MPSARASGTLMNTGNSTATYSVYLEAEKQDPYSNVGLVTSEVNATSKELTPGTSAYLVLNSLDLGTLVSLSARARVVVKVTAPAEGKLATPVYSSWSAWYSGVTPTYTPTWSTQPTISSGPMRISGNGVEAEFDIGMEENFPWKVVVVGVGIAGIIWYLGRKKRR